MVLILRDDGKLLATITPGDDERTFRVLSKHVGSIREVPPSPIEAVIPELSEISKFSLEFELKE